MIWDYCSGCGAYPDWPRKVRDESLDCGEWVCPECGQVWINPNQQEIDDDRADCTA